MKFNYLKYDDIGSTNKTLAEMHRTGAEEFTTVRARRQSGGRGRLDRSFYSDGGLYMSVLLKPDFAECDVTLLTLFAATCAHRAVKRVCGVDLSIKWVNDLLSEKGKVAGILCEAHTASDGSVGVIVGIGINVGRIDFPPELYGIADCIDLPEPKRERAVERLLKDIVKRLSRYRKALEKKDFLTYYRMHCGVIDKRVTVSGDGEPYEAIVMGVSDDGGLMIFSEKGARILKYGEISVREVKEE